MPILDEGALAASLRDLPGWSRDGDSLTRTFRRRDWRDAINLVNAVADEAERREHHPDVSITGYRNVTFRLTSHDSGGITSRDVNLARRVDELASERREGR
jgi:4a-hydroxytetrahydrobiopterin dehydratase